MNNDAISKSWILNELDAWGKQVGTYHGNDCCEIARRETVQEMLVECKEVVKRAPAARTMKEYVSVTVVSTLDNPWDYTPCTAVFSNRNTAENFKRALESLFKRHGQADCYHVSVDSGAVDSESYLEIFEMDVSE